MAEQENSPRIEEDGLPGSEVVFAGGNVIALAATALGGVLVWIAAGVAAVALALVASRRRATNRSRGLSASRTPGRALGRSGSRSGGRTGGRSTGSSGTGKGRSGPVGRILGRTGTGRGKGGRTAGANGAARTGGKASKSAARTGPGANGRKSRWPLGRSATGSGRTGRAPSGHKTGSSRAGSGRPGSSGRTSKLLPSWIGTAGRKTAKKGTVRPAAKTTAARPAGRPTAPKPGVAGPTAPAKPATPPTNTRQSNDRPHHTSEPATGSTQKGTMKVFGRKWRENAEEIHTQAARYDPEQMPEYLQDLKDLTGAFETESQALGKVAAVSESDLPVHPDLTEYIRTMQSLLRKVSEEAGSVVSHFQKLHEDDLKRHQSPRPGEQKWNVK